MDSPDESVDWYSGSNAVKFDHEANYVSQSKHCPQWRNGPQQPVPPFPTKRAMKGFGEIDSEEEQPAQPAVSLELKVNSCQGSKRRTPEVREGIEERRNT